MLLVVFLNRLIKQSGFNLVDASGNVHQIGSGCSGAQPLTVKILDKKLYYKLLFYPDLYFGEAYTEGTLQVENGTISDLLEILVRNLGRKMKVNRVNAIIRKIQGVINYTKNLNYLRKSKENVAHHYDITDELYGLFLDLKRQYSCAYFKSDNDSLETAQNNKMQHIIKKLVLEGHQRVLDIGSGWGYLAMEIAKQSKCAVTGITLSENQLAFSNRKAKEYCLHNRVNFKLADYRSLNEKYDRIVSIGMFEHVGKAFYDQFFQQIFHSLNDDGVALIHTIGSVSAPRDPQPWIQKYIFPGGHIPSLSEVMGPIEQSGLMVSDMEVLKLHYSHTLRHWKERFLANEDKVLELFDDRFLRMWEFYLASSEYSFKWGHLVVYQFQLTKKLTATPNTRSYIY